MYLIKSLTTFLTSLHRVIISVGKEMTKWGCALQKDCKCHAGPDSIFWVIESGRLLLKTTTWYNKNINI